MIRKLSCIAALLTGALVLASAAAPAAGLPNILWIVAEDINPQLGCYGDSYAVTPNIDRFATNALRYTKCWSTAPVCAPARTALITGVYPTSLGAEHMRSLVTMPDFMRMYPQFLRDRGYYCVNNAKEDYNVQKPGKVWNESSNRAHWKNRQPGQPFFAAFNIDISHESQIRIRPHTLQHDPAEVRLPAYHPDTPEVRHDWAQYYDNITAMDAIAGKHLQELADAGLADATIVFFYGDNGGGMPRSKRWPYNSGLNVPLIIRVPDKFKHLAPPDYLPGAATDRLVAFVDFAPTLLSLAGVKPPDCMQGHAFMGQFAAAPQKYLFGFRGRMDERCDLVRSVRNDRFIYARNFMPHLIYGQFLAYMFETPTTRIWKQLYDDGKLKPPQTYFWETKPPEELYDLQTDPDEVRNLANSPEPQVVLGELRQALHDHTLATRDVGFLTEAEMHRCAGGSTPYALGHDVAKYPLDRILAMAELASALKPNVAASRESADGTVAKLKEGLRDSDSGVRYWATLGLLMRGTNAVVSARNELRAALKDESPSIRVAAARALGQHGNDGDLAPALAALKELAPPDRNGGFVSLEALSVLEALGKKADPLREFLRTMPRTDPNATERTAKYVANFLPHLLSAAGGVRPSEEERKPSP
jgi:arylsulfatase A-like enzyme